MLYALYFNHIFKMPRKHLEMIMARIAIAINTSPHKFERFCAVEKRSVQGALFLHGSDRAKSARNRAVPERSVISAKNRFLLGNVPPFDSPER